MSAPGAQQFGDLPQIVDECRHLSLPYSVVRSAKDRRRMHGSGCVLGEFGVDQLTTLTVHAKSFAEERLRRRRSEAHQHLRPDDPDFSLDPWPGSSNLDSSGFLVYTPLASFRRRPLEVLDDIGHINFVTFDARLLQRTV